MNINEYKILKKNRKTNVVIYTAISGGYDDLIQHKYISKDFDYVCFTDTPVDNPGIWDIRPLENRGYDENRNAKYYKIFPHKFFPDYEYSIWIDGNIDIINDELEKVIFELIKTNCKISANIHFERSCIYQEANICMRYNLDDPDIIYKQVEFLRENGFPENYGLYEMNIIFRKHSDTLIQKIMNDWWDMIVRFSKRDQLSFMYVLYKNKMQCTQMFEKNPRNMYGFIFHPHNQKQKIYSVLYIDDDQGFNNSLIVEKLFCKNRNNFSVIYKIDKFKNKKKLRFNPIAGQGFKCKIISIETDGIFNKIEWDNATKKENDWDIFYTLEPIYVLDGNFNEATYIKITGYIELIDYKMLITNFEHTRGELEHTRGELEHTRGELNAVYNSKKWRIAVKLEKIARKTGFIYVVKGMLKVYFFMKKLMKRKENKLI